MHLSPSLSDLRAKAWSLAEGINADIQPLQNLSVLNKVTAMTNEATKKEWAVWVITNGLKGRWTRARTPAGGCFGWHLLLIFPSSTVSPSLLQRSKPAWSKSAASIASATRSPSPMCASCHKCRLHDGQDTPTVGEMQPALRRRALVDVDSSLCARSFVPSLFRFDIDLSQYPRISAIEKELSTHPAFIAGHANAQPDKPEGLVVA